MKIFLSVFIFSIFSTREVFAAIETNEALLFSFGLLISIPLILFFIFEFVLKTEKANTDIKGRGLYWLQKIMKFFLTFSGSIILSRVLMFYANRLNISGEWVFPSLFFLAFLLSYFFFALITKFRYGKYLLALFVLITFISGGYFLGIF